MKAKIFSVLQRIGRSFMLPIAVLPVAGLFLGIGSSLTSNTTISSLHLEAILGKGTFFNNFLTILTILFVKSSPKKTYIVFKTFEVNFSLSLSI